MVQLSKLLFFSLIIAQLCCTPERKYGSRESHEQEGHVNAGGGVRLFFRLLGSGPDTVVVIHGGPGFTMDYFFEDLRPLADNHVLIFYDQRGAGRSSLVTDSASLAAQRFVDDLEAIRKHFGIKRINLLGHSWGTVVEALYAIRFQDNVGKLIAVGAVPLQESQLIEAFDKMEKDRDSVKLRRMRELDSARTVDPTNMEICKEYYTLWFEPFYGDPSKPPSSKGDFCAGSPESHRNKINGVDKFTFQSLARWDWRSLLREVHNSTLVIHGTKDPLPSAGAKEWKDVLPNGELLLMEGIGHFPYIEAPDQFFKAVNEFLKNDE
jgi:proline iminopeptidase